MYHEIRDALEGMRFQTHDKGWNLQTEMFSAFKAEVPIESDLSTMLDSHLIQHIESYDRYLRFQ